MQQVICEECGKIIEGYTEKHIRTLLAQHMIKHQNEMESKGG